MNPNLVNTTSYNGEPNFALRIWIHAVSYPDAEILLGKNIFRTTFRCILNITIANAFK